MARLYHAFLTGLILSLVVRKGSEIAAELVFRLFRAKQQEQFLLGLDKLGLRGLPDAVACAQYHYLSNQLGGVRVEYMPESDQKAWIRYPPPRWIWAGTAIAAIPSEVSAAMLRGWHAHNGVSLDNSRLGFVCTKMTVDGRPGLEGYYLDHGRALGEGERLRFAPDEEAPAFDPSKAPRVEAGSWPPERLQKAYRNYAMDYVRTALVELVSLLGDEEARTLGGLTARLIAMQHVDELAALTGIQQRDGRAFAELFARLARAQGDEIEVETPSSPEGSGLCIRQHGWRLMRRAPTRDQSVFEIWNQLWAGGLSTFDRFSCWKVEVADLKSSHFRYRIAPRGPTTGERFWCETPNSAES